MNTPVKLADIVNALECQADEATQYLNKKTGEIEFVPNDLMHTAEEGEQPPERSGEWEREALQLAREIITTNDYIELPSKWDIHEWEIMRNFCLSLEDEDMQEDLLDAIHGRGAFRMFKDRIHRLGIAEDWYKYRREALREIAIEWCQANGIEYIESAEVVEIAPQGVSTCVIRTAGEAKTIRWGIIGCGNVTEAKSGPAFQKAEHSTLVAVMRRNGKLANDYALRHGVPKWYDNAESLIHDPEVDAVYIATPPAFHKKYALAVARAGKPVYVEKPMALNYAECEEMIEACEKASVPLFVAYYRRALPRFLKVKQLLDDKAIGEIRSVNVAFYQQPSPNDLDIEKQGWRVKPEISGGGYFCDLACHTLDLLMFYFGPINKVCGFASNQAELYEAEDIVTGLFNFESGIHGVGTWCFSAYGNLDAVEIVGTKGKMGFSTFGADPVTLVTGERSEQFHIEHPPHVQQPLIQTVVNALLGQGSCPSTGRTAAMTNWVMDEMLKGYGSRPISAQPGRSRKR